MRLHLVALLCCAFGIAGFGQNTPNLKLSQVSGGTLSGDVYTNETVGMVYEVPSGWSAYTDVKHATMLDQKKSNGAANQCSKILLSLQAPHPVEGRFRQYSSPWTQVAFQPLKVNTSFRFTESNGFWVGWT